MSFDAIEAMSQLLYSMTNSNIFLCVCHQKMEPPKSFGRRDEDAKWMYGVTRNYHNVGDDSRSNTPLPCPMFVT